MGPWPGRGPFSYLPPWQRPEWLFGKASCWWLFNPYLYGYQGYDAWSGYRVSTFGPWSSYGGYPFQYQIPYSYRGWNYPPYSYAW